MRLIVQFRTKTIISIGTAASSIHVMVDYKRIFFNYNICLFQEYSVTFSSYFNVLWQEPRLRISERFLRELNHSVTTPETMIPVNLELVNDLWLPNIFIYNLKTFKVCNEKNANFFIRICQELLLN